GAFILPKTPMVQLAIPSPGTPDPRRNADSDSRVISLEEDSNVVNVLLHTIYGLDSSSYAPSLETLFSTVACLEKYGYPLATFLSRQAQEGPSLFNLILAYAPERPMDVYSFAA